MYDAPVQPVPRCNDHLDDDADVPHLTIGWVDGTPGIFRIGEGVNESGVGHAADAVAGRGEVDLRAESEAVMERDNGEDGNQIGPR